MTEQLKKEEKEISVSIPRKRGSSTLL